MTAQQISIYIYITDEDQDVLSLLKAVVAMTSLQSQIVAQLCSEDYIS